MDEAKEFLMRFCRHKRIEVHTTYRGAFSPYSAPVAGSADLRQGRIYMEVWDGCAPAQEVSALAHEIGHLLDPIGLQRYEGIPALHLAMLGTAGLTAPQFARVWGSETYAWRVAAELLRDAGFQDWAAFFRLKRICLKSYLNPYKRARRRETRLLGAA